MLSSTPPSTISRSTLHSASSASASSAPSDRILSTTQQISSIVRADARVLPSAAVPRTFTAHNTSDIANASTHFAGDSQYKMHHPNAICVTSAVTSNLNELCTLAFDMNQNGESVCAWRGSYVVSMDDENLPADGMIKECGQIKDPNEVCVPKGTVAIACGASAGGVNVGGGNYSMTPSWIAVPKSEVDILLHGYGNCYSAHPAAADKKYAYVKTSNFQVAYSNPNQYS